MVVAGLWNASGRSLRRFSNRNQRVDSSQWISNVVADLPNALKVSDTSSKRSTHHIDTQNVLKLLLKYMKKHALTFFVSFFLQFLEHFLESYALFLLNLRVVLKFDRINSCLKLWISIDKIIKLCNKSTGTISMAEQLKFFLLIVSVFRWRWASPISSWNWELIKSLQMIELNHQFSFIQQLLNVELNVHKRNHVEIRRI